MEESRLQPMKEGYDVKLFNDLYDRTRKLRHKLAAGIDSRRFGVDFQEILSWFDVKFIYCFNKYWSIKTTDHLLAYIINSLQFFKYRIIRSANTHKFSQHIINTDDVFSLVADEADVNEEEAKEDMLTQVLDFMRQKLSDNALLILELQLNPPIYMQSRLSEEGKHDFTKIPNSLYIEYLELGNSDGAIKLVEHLKKEISHAMSSARTHFTQSSLRLAAH